LTRRERIARGDSRWRLAGGDDDLLVGLQDEICRVARLRLPVQPPVQLAAVAAEAAPAEADAPLAEELTERVRPILRRLDMDHSVRLVSVQLGDERTAENPDRRRYRHPLAVYVDVEVLVDVEGERFLGERVEVKRSQMILELPRAVVPWRRPVLQPRQLREIDLHRLRLLPTRANRSNRHTHDHERKQRGAADPPAPIKRLLLADRRRDHTP